MIRWRDLFDAMIFAGVIAMGCTAAQLNRIDPPLLVNDNTSRICQDGTRCMNYLECPNLAAPGVCGGYIFPGVYGERIRDAGVDAR
jgi:hypothetical protein